MGQPIFSKKRFLDGLLALALLLAATDGEKPSDELQVETGQPRHAMEPLWYEKRLLALLDRKTDGTLALPTKAQVEAAVGPSKDPRVRERSMMALLEEFERAAKQSDSRTKTAMTASVFALTVAGLLLKAKADIVVPVTIFAAGLAFLGVSVGVVGHDFYVGRRPVQRLCMTDVLNARACLFRKEFYAKLTAILAALALLIQLVSVTVARSAAVHERTKMVPPKSATPPRHSITSPAVYSGGQARPQMTMSAERKTMHRPVNGMSPRRHSDGCSLALPSRSPCMAK